MQKITSCISGLLVILFFASSIVLGEDSGSCPIGLPNNQTVLNSPVEPVVGWASNLSVPRNQVLLEIFTGTW